MKEKTCKTVRFYYGIAMAVMTVVVGALFIWQVLDIYLTGTSPNYTGEQIFSRKIVSDHLATIAPAFWLWIAMIIAGFVLWEIFPVNPKRAAYRDNVYALNRLKRKLPDRVNETFSNSVGYIKREELIILTLKLCCAALYIAGAIYCIVYLANPAHFPKTDVTGEMLNMAKHVMPCALIALALSCGVVAYENHSAKKQLAEVKKMVAARKNDLGGTGVNTKSDNKIINFFYKIKARVGAITSDKRFVLGVRIAIGCLGLAFIIAGAVNGSVHSVLVKAINICTECIGLG